jgi:hypothetical protein
VRSCAARTTIEFETSVLPDRLATDGDRLVAWRAETTLGPDVIVLFDLNTIRYRSPRSGPTR